MDTTPSRPAHANSFNFLRFALAGAVVLGHSFELLRRHDPFDSWFGYAAKLGSTSVAGFFLISGCLITASWQRNPSLQHYLSRRCWRIYPGFAVAYLVSALFVGPLGGNPRYWEEFAPGRVVPEILTLHQPTTPEVFAGQFGRLVNGSLWTIKYEFVCYLIVAALGMVGLLARRRLILSLAGATLVAYFTQLVVRRGGYRDDVLFGEVADFPRLLACFLIGACVHLYRPRFTWRGSACVALLFLASTWIGYTTTLAALPLAMGYLMFALANAPLPALRAWDRLPDVSYGLYLYAWPIQVLLIYQLPAIGPIPLFFTSFGLSLLAGIASWYLVERRFLQRQNQGSVPDSVPSPSLLFPLGAARGC